MFITGASSQSAHYVVELILPINSMLTPGAPRFPYKATCMPHTCANNRKTTLLVLCFTLLHSLLLFTCYCIGASDTGIMISRAHTLCSWDLDSTFTTLC